MPAVLRLAVAAALLALGGIALAQPGEYPNKPIRLVVPFTPGTSIDIMARVVAQRLSEDWGQQAVVENRSGAGGIIGTEYGAKAAPDGYVLTMAASGAFAVNPGLYAKLPYDPVRDFAPIAGLALVPQVLVTGASSGYRTVKDLVDAARKDPGKIAYGSLGTGTTSHLTMEIFRAAAGIELIHVPFKGTAEAQAQLLGGQIPAMFDPIPATRPNILSGKLRGLAIATLVRSPFLPEVPTLAESGYPGFEAVGWIGIAAPVQTPPAIVEKLNVQMNRMLNHPEVKERLAALAFTPTGGSREQFAAFIRAEIAKWGKAIRDSGAKAD
ncbi:MAG: tripartite tricarboxylate transporter substrate binding protein [Betaproteobacteria bacterium]|nr:tripartite tricarboxylate transporter substrate binding protein [Betaproteobacteria bacterium]